MINEGPIILLTLVAAGFIRRPLGPDTTDLGGARRRHFERRALVNGAARLIMRPRAALPAALALASLADSQRPAKPRGGEAPEWRPETVLQRCKSSTPLSVRPRAHAHSAATLAPESALAATAAEWAH